MSIDFRVVLLAFKFCAILGLTTLQTASREPRIPTPPPARYSALSHTAGKPGAGGMSLVLNTASNTPARAVIRHGERAPA